MENVEAYITELLYNHDCLIIPDFGGFITHYRPAAIHPLKNTFTPPSKEVAFNIQLQKNDGLLQSYLSEKLSVNSTEALSIIKEYVQEINYQIEKAGFFLFEGLGKFNKNKEQNVQFIPNQEINFLEDSFELPEFYFKPIEREEDTDMKRVPPRPRPVRRPPVKRTRPAGEATVNKAAAEKAVKAKAEKEAKPKVQKEKAPKEPKAPRSQNKNPLYLVLPVVLLLAVGVGVGIYFAIGAGAHGGGHGTDLANAGHGNTNEASMVPTASTDETSDDSNDEASPEESNSSETVAASGSSENGENVEEVTATETDEPTATEETETSPSEETAEEESTSSDAEKEEAVEETTPEPEPTSAPAEITSRSGRYHIIAGSFGDKANAEKLINKIGSGSSIIEPSGSSRLYKVSIKSYNSWAAAKADISTFSGEYGSGIWIMKY